MDGNKDDALKCLEIGKEALDAGDRARALKFLTKARRLDPTLPIDNLLSEAAERKFNDQPSISRSFRSNGPAAAAASSTSAGADSYTEDQIMIVKQINKKNDYYEILGLEKTCSVEDVQKAYRKLSLKVHPVNNKAPGAEEAFKAVSKAFQCLNNEERRKTHDLVGSDEPVYERRAPAYRGGGDNGFNGFYDTDFDADEISRNFFFSGMAPATTQFRGFHFEPEMGATGFNIRALILLLSVLLILLLNFLPSSQPVFSMSRAYPYKYKFTTQKGVDYYARSKKFEQDYPVSSPERTRMEECVEREYYWVLAQNCRLELQQQHWGFICETPHCNLLQKFQSAA